MKKARCANCYAEFHEFINISEGAEIVPGAINVCHNCGEVCQFGEDLVLKPMNTEQILDLVHDNPEIYNAIVHAVTIINAKIRMN